MSEHAFTWEATIFDAAPQVSGRDGDYGLNYGDVDKGGAVELIMPGDGALVCYKLNPPRRKVIANEISCVGVCLADFDNDGIAEVLTTFRDPLLPGRQCPRTPDTQELIELGNARRGIASVGWNESHVDLWSPPS